MNIYVLSISFYIAGYATAIAAFGWLARKCSISTEGIYYLLAAGLIGGLLGANLVQYLATGAPGKTVLGGIIFGYLSVVIAKRILGIKRPTGDLFAFGISAGESVGRWGCFFAGCCGGKAAPNWVWPRVYDDHIWRYPSQAYDSLANAFIFILLCRILKRNPPENTLFYVQGLLYCCFRFGIEYTRQAAPVSVGLTLAQIGCLFGAVFFGFRLSQLLTANRRIVRDLSEVDIAQPSGKFSNGAFNELAELS